MKKLKVHTYQLNIIELDLAKGVDQVNLLIKLTQLFQHKDQSRLVIKDILLVEGINNLIKI